MRKERFKGFASGVVTTLLIMAMSISVLAAAQTIKVNGGIKLKIDGQIFTPKDANGKTVDVFEYNGTTYVPLRAVSQAFGKEIAWDGTTRTAIIGSNGASGSHNRQNPAPVGKAQEVKVESYTSGTSVVNITVTEVLRGAAAWEKIISANQFNDAAPEGYEYILVKVKATVVSNTKDAAFAFGWYNFTGFSSDNTEYKNVSVVEPDPQFSGNVYAGGTLEGYLSFAVKTTDVSPKMSFGTNYDGTGGIWFSLVSE